MKSLSTDSEKQDSSQKAIRIEKHVKGGEEETKSSSTINVSTSSSVSSSSTKEIDPEPEEKDETESKDDEIKPFIFTGRNKDLFVHMNVFRILRLLLSTKSFHRKIQIVRHHVPGYNYRVCIVNMPMQ